MFGIVSTAQKILIGVLISAIVSIGIYALKLHVDVSQAEQKLAVEQLNASNYRSALFNTRTALKRKIAALESIQEIERERSQRQATRAQRLESKIDELHKIQRQTPETSPEISYHNCLGVRRPDAVVRLRNSTGGGAD